MAPNRRLATWRKRRGLTLEAAAKLLGCDMTALSRIEGGTRTPGRRIANAIERETEGLAGGPVRSVDWDRHEDLLERRRAG